MIKLLGVVLLAVGIVLIIIGVDSSRSLADNPGTMFRGRLTEHAPWYIFGGIASAVDGLFLVIGVFGRIRSSVLALRNCTVTGKIF